MFSKVFISLLVVASLAYVSEQNPAANRRWHWIHKRVKVTPNPNAAHYKDVLVPPRKISSSGTVRVDNCGFSQVSQSKIVGGTEVDPPHSYPWQAALFIDGLYFCGGSIINNEYILTAGHCLNGARRVKAVLGAQNVQQDEASQVTIISTDLIVNENYNSLLIKNDIALVHLPEKIIFNEYIQPVCLPAYSDPYLTAGTLVTPTGWGLTSDSATSISPTLQKVTVPVMSTANCDAYYGTVDDRQICIDSTGGRGTCNGDSGGPLNYVGDGGATFVRGITSFGSSLGCESGAPDAFTRVSYFLSWISDNTGISIDP